jgi:NADH-quinone oxidoreductase subunit L
MTLLAIPAIPALAFVLLALIGRRMPRPAAALLGVGAVAASAALTIAASAQFAASGAPMSESWGRWVVADLTLRFDGLTAVMLCVISTVASLILLYSIRYMADDEGYSRFFAYMSLFVAAMELLVLAGNLLVLYLGWEGVGLCSFLLIGFWYRRDEAVAAARKAFVVTRIGDTVLLLGLIFIYSRYGTLDIPAVLAGAAAESGEFSVTLAAMLILAGALGKSAQIPLQTWLPDAMAGPTPVSALIHAATMVIAGVYLVARLGWLFAAAPLVMELVAALGAVTMLYAGLAACAQRDLKRALAYSTMSQIGLMFLALGVGAWSAGIFHFASHAVFKPLLFLSAGSVIVAMHHNNDMTRMGGLWRRLPVEFWTFLIGASALAALPVVTAGFWSKEPILAAAWSSPMGTAALWWAGVTGSLLTATYSFRMVFLVFMGPARTQGAAGLASSPAALAALVLLAILSLAGGLGGAWVQASVAGALPPLPGAHDAPAWTAAAPIAATGVGIAIAWLLWLRGRQAWARLTGGPLGSLGAAIEGGMGFDAMYDLLLVRPLKALVRAMRGDWFGGIYWLIERAAAAGHWALAAVQTGNLRWYLWLTAATAAGLVAALVWR